MQAGTHNGASTIHQVQLMCPKSLRAINSMVNSPRNPIPEEDDEFSLIEKFILRTVFNSRNGGTRYAKPLIVLGDSAHLCEVLCHTCF